IDSALVAALAVDALGPNRVTAVTMPSQYSSYETLRDAKLLAVNLGLKLHSLPIKEPYAAFNNVLAPVLKQFDSQRDPQNLTDQNLQARIRGVYLMALSNRTGRIVLNTSNKSEGSVGYGTLYGDLVGGLSVLIDLWKTDVWALSRWINKNAGKEIIPVSTIDRIPSAELRPHQEDRHSIPDYPVLDPIMKMFVEEEKSLEEIVAAGYNRSAVELALKLYNRNEFKRRQCPPGLYLTSCPLAQKQRPMTNRFAE
ncbi:MAG: NAD(+) synthase, partial [Thermoguttaceae bacterium]|nr:NAD(+) synthase [Thermoguttaceae bacterium]